MNSKKTLKGSTQKKIFVALMLLYPVLQFGLFFVYVNIDTIVLTFQKFSWTTGEYIFSGFSNYSMVFDRIMNDASTQRMLTNSLLYMPVTSFVILPLSMMFSYFLYKKIPLSGAFRVIYFLPSIMPIVVMTMSFSFIFDSNLGPVNDIYLLIMKIFDPNVVVPSWFGEYPTNQYMIFVYCVWVGLGFNIILLSGAIARIPEELMEYGQIEGISFTQEFFKVVMPLIWPTITTTFILGMTSVFTVMLQPMLLTPTSGETNTLALMVYNSVLRDQNIEYTATFGIVVSLIGLPVILLIKRTMTSFFKEVDY